MVSLPSTTHYSPSPTTFLTTKSNSRFSISSTSSDTPQPPSHLRRPKIVKSPPSTSKPPLPSPPPPSKPPFNPLKSLKFSQTTPDPLTPKLRLTRTLSPPPPPPPPPTPPPPKDDTVSKIEEGSSRQVEFRQEGKIFLGNLPLWVKKPEVAEFFRQFGPIKSVILIKGHDDLERNLGFGFVIYDGPMADKAAMKAVEFDGVEFHGRVLTVKLDDGRRLKSRSEERVRWVEEGGDAREYRSKWHEDREDGRKEFRRVLESMPENWQAVIRAFERINKV